MLLGRIGDRLGRIKHHPPYLQVVRIIFLYSSNKMSIKQDLSFGFQREDELFSKMKDKYGENIRKTNAKCRVDYESEDVEVELKSRRNTYNKYPTTMISKGKIDYMMNNNKRSFCAFCFTDGLYHIEITPETISKFQLREGGRWDRGRAEVSLYYYIPIKMLELVE